MSAAGHYPVVSVLVVVFVLSSLGIGQLISTVSSNQGQAVLLAVFYIMPTFVLSGAFTPIETQPAGLRPVALAFPLTYFCHGFRAAIMRGDIEHTTVLTIESVSRIHFRGGSPYRRLTR